jgi:hypothetical protein
MHYERWRRHGDPLIVVTPRRSGTHRMTKSLEWNTWSSMKSRCLNQNSDAYPDYGGRGIAIHGPWIKSFEAFLAYMGPRPGAAYSIDRIDNDGNYEPGNVRWATRSQQNANQRKRDKCKKGHFYDEQNTYITPAGSRQCRKCKKLLKGDRLPIDRRKPCCKFGHEYTPENTYITKKGTRECRECKREASRRSKEGNREKTLAAGRDYMARRRAGRARARAGAIADD